MIQDFIPALLTFVSVVAVAIGYFTKLLPENQFYERRSLTKARAYEWSAALFILSALGALASMPLTLFGYTKCAHIIFLVGVVTSIIGVLAYAIALIRLPSYRDK